MGSEIIGIRVRYKTQRKKENTYDELEWREKRERWRMKQERRQTD